MHHAVLWISDRDTSATHTRPVAEAANRPAAALQVEGSREAAAAAHHAAVETMGRCSSRENGRHGASNARKLLQFNQQTGNGRNRNMAATSGIAIIGAATG